MLLDKRKDILFLKPDHCSGFLFAFAWTLPPDAWQLASVRHLIDQGQATFKKLLYILWCE